jgi:hypothetical protein
MRQTNFNGLTTQFSSTAVREFFSEHTCQGTTTDPNDEYSRCVQSWYRDRNVAGSACDVSEHDSLLTDVCVSKD